MKWEGCEWTECNIGGGEEIEGYEYEDGGPPTLCQPASQQGGGEEVNNLAGGAWRGLEECWGLWENFWFKIFGFSFHFHTRSLFSINCEPGIGGSACTSFWPRLNERRHLDESESFVF